MTFLVALLLYPLYPLSPLTPQSPNDLAISVQIRTTPLTGRGFGTAGSDRGDEVIARVTADENFCRAGSGDFGLTVQHDYSWELTGRIVGRSADSVTAEVTWKQLEGPGAGGAARSQTVTLRNGERAVLESIRPAGTKPCAAEGQLEIEAGSRIRFLPMVGGIPSGSGATSIGAGSRGGIAAGAGGGGGRGSGVAAGGISTGTGTGRNFELRDPAGMPGALPPGAPFSVEIWLVHTLPNGTERVEAHDRADNVTGVTKKFGPVSIATPTGNASITVGVDLRTFARSQNPLSILINREEAIDGKVGHGGTSRVTEVPPATEIISLELPTSSRYADRFSVRLKFTKPGAD